MFGSFTAQIRAAAGRRQAAANEGRLQRGADGGVQSGGLQPAQQRRPGQVSGPGHFSGHSVSVI